MTTLMKASTQWSTRAADERFNSLAAIHAAALADRERAAISKPTHLNKLTVEAEGKNLVLVGGTGSKADFTNWSFGQLCGLVGAPASFIPELLPETAATVMNERLGLIKKEADRESRLLLKTDGNRPTLRSISGGKWNDERTEFKDSYKRIWNCDITSRLIELESDGRFQPAPAAFDGSRGLYLGDRDMFAFMVDSDRRIFEKAPGGGLSRGFFCWNSEVGASAFGIMTFLYEFVCGNHRVWGASNVKEIRIRHVGDADAAAFDKLRAKVIEYADGSATEDEARITRCMSFELGKDKDAVLDAIFHLRGNTIPLHTIRDAYTLAEKRESWYGNPRSAWGMAGALTEVARDLPNADRRAALEQGASKVMEMAF